MSNRHIYKSDIISYVVQGESPAGKMSNRRRCSQSGFNPLDNNNFCNVFMLFAGHKRLEYFINLVLYILRNILLRRNVLN